MNLEYLQFDLAEAHLHLTALLHELATDELGPDDSPELAVQLEHITDHLHRAWNRRNFSDAEIMTQTQEEFERHCNTAPNFFSNRILGEFALCSDRPLNIEHIQFQLGDALDALQQLISELKTGQLGPDDRPGLAVSLEHITNHIHAAWNCRMMPLEAVTDLTQEEFERCCNTVPNFHGTRLLGEDLF